MNIFKLSYIDKEQALADLKAKGILVEVEFNGQKHEAYGDGVQAVVEIGLIVLEIVDDQPIYADGYHYDVMSTETYDFGANLVVPTNPKHAFAGYPITDEMPNDEI